jgi:hypothetical protein
MGRPGLTAVFVALGCVLAGAAALVGISDNPPGIALLYGGLVCLILAVVHRWRRPKCFLLLFAVSALGFLVFAVLHNLLHAIGVHTSVPWLRSAMEILHVTCFLIALLLCPAGLAFGLVGWLAAVLRSRGAPEAPTTQ